MMPFLRCSRRFLSLLLPLALLTAAGDAAAVTAGGVTVDVVATQSWGSGFNGAVRFTNSSFPSAVTSWQAVFRFNGSVQVQGNGWHGTISAPDASGNITARNAPWVTNLGTGQSMDEGFTANGAFSGATFVSLTVNGQNVPLGGTGDTTAPSVSLASSATSVTTAQTITLTSTATDNVGVARVEFYDGSTLLGSDTTSPYTWGIALASANNGTKSYTARAFDAAGNSATSAAVTVTVNIQQAGDTTPPTVSLASNVTNVTTARTITLTATASDNVGVTRVELYDGATLLVSDTSAPYSTTVALTAANNGTKSYTARAFDAAGNSRTSTAVTVTVNIATGDTTPPTVSLTSNATNVTTARTITLTATASDNVGVARVEFYDGTTLLASDTSSPYSTTVALTAANNGTKSYTARAFDAAGNNRTSTAVTVTVNIPGSDTTPPTVSLTSSATNVTAAQTITLSATASDNVGVARVDFYDGTTLLASDASSPYAATVSLTSANNGTRSYTARAFDAAGNNRTSTAVTVTVNIQGGSTSPVYTASGGRFLKDGAEIRLYGLNWFGMETPDRVVHGLWTGRQVDDFLADFKAKGFNALRLPLSPQAIQPGFPIDSGPYDGNDCAAMCGEDGRTALEYMLQRMQAAGMYALLDFHTCNPAQLGSGLPGSPIGCSGYTMNNWLADLTTLANLSKTYPNVIGVDIVNEPHALTWSQFRDMASQAGQAILAANPNTTVWVEGVGNSSPSGVPGGANWGQNLYEAGAIAGIPNSKLVYSPHSYGPSVAAMSYFSDASFPSNMPAIWDTMFGHLFGEGYTVVIGEYGGQYTGTDKTWNDAFVAYLKAKGTRNQFWWCVNPNSGDTGGVLQNDWRTWNTAKLTLLQSFMQ